MEDSKVEGEGGGGVGRRKDCMGKEIEGGGVVNRRKDVD